MPSFNLGNFRRSRAPSRELIERSRSVPVRCRTTLTAAEAAAHGAAGRARPYSAAEALLFDATGYGSLEGEGEAEIQAVATAAAAATADATSSGGSGGARAACARWWVLLMYCLLAAIQSATWNTFIPVYPAVLQAFPSWGPSYLSWLLNVTNISFGLLLWPAAFLAQRFGARSVTVASAVIVLLCAGLRCLPLGDTAGMRAVMIASMLCNGAGGGWTGFGGPVLSELWFPSSQRTMATAIGVTATAAGSAVGFVVGPAIVGQPTNQTLARAAVNRLFYWEAGVAGLCLIGILAYFPDQPAVAPSGAAAAKRALEASVAQQESGAPVMTAAAASAENAPTTPDSSGDEAPFGSGPPPPLPPLPRRPRQSQEQGGPAVVAAASKGIGAYFACCLHCCHAGCRREGRGTAAAGAVVDGAGGRGAPRDRGDDAARREAAMWGEFAGAVVTAPRLPLPVLTRARRTSTVKFWIAASALGIPLGVYQAWSSVLYSCISDTNVTEDEAAWLGFSMTMSGCFASVVVAAVLDRFLGYLKLVSTVLMFIAMARSYMVAFGVFCANAAGFFPGLLTHGDSVSVTFVTGIAGGMSLNIAIPLMFELIMEQAMLAIAINTAVQVAFLVVLAQQPPGVDNLWTAWATAASMGVCALIMTFFRVEYRRLSVDRGTPLKDTGCIFDRAVGCY